ncbi:uncharacterized protein LOC112568131 isoform X2 [Pomacea canaliculata]|uniref:uncharacterized protein LOC112568131 isoform X2 n=1 Tax=Pomacea canaliculata TaxID=400727 RepID=UPI000D72E6FF|nr:uncharacterized protein LOC112568131 isoform X2 [Pomacea canaliculata]
MEKWSFVLACFVCLNMIIILVSGLTIPNCVAGRIYIPQDTSTLITCSNIPETEKVTWTVENDRTETIFKHVCGSITACNGVTQGDISLHNYRDDGVSLVINRNHRQYEGFNVTCSTTTEHAACRMHVFHTAELSPCETIINPRLWTIAATCPVNKFFSPKQNVSCGVTERQNLLNSPMTIRRRFTVQLHLQDYTDTVDNNTYQRGSCRFTMYLPTSPGNYSYIIHIRPGPAQETGVEVWTDNLKPSCAKFSQENPNVSCECYERDSGSFSDTGANYACNIVRGSTSQTRQPSLSTTTQTTLGSQSVRIVTNATQPFVTDGTAQMALFCQTDDVYPNVSYTWANVTCINEHHQLGTCIFTPRVPNDDGLQVACEAYNVVSREPRTSDIYTIQLNYPPPSPPILHRYREGLTEGETITLYCAVKGGKPKVASVRFVCGDEPDNSDIVDGMSVWSRVVINVRTKHNNTVCLCSATWSPQPRFYPDTTSVRLYVNERTTPRSPSVTTTKMFTTPRQTPVTTTHVTRVTTSSDGMVSSPSPQSNTGQSVPIGIIAGIVAAIVVTVIVIAAIVYFTRRKQNRSTTRNTGLVNKKQDDDFQEQVNEFYISADALALNRIHPVGDFSQSCVQDPVAHPSPHKGSEDTNKSCMVQAASNSIVSLPAHQTQTVQPCLKEFERNRETTMSNTENLYAVVDKNL